MLEDFPVADISEHLKNEDACVWLDYCDPTGAELATIAEEFQLHPLAVEDAVNAHQRPKLDRYDTHLFLSSYAVNLDTESGELRTHEVDAFITTQALITVRADEGVPIDSVVAHWDASKELARHGVSFLLWGLLDDITGVLVFDGAHHRAFNRPVPRLPASRLALAWTRPRAAQARADTKTAPPAGAHGRVRAAAFAARGRAPDA